MGAQHLKIPRGLLKALCYAGGTRLPRIMSLPRDEPEAMAVQVPTVIRPTYHGFHAVTEIAVKGNISNDAYRWFRGDPSPNSKFFQCRGCLEEEMDLSLKVAHVKSCRGLIQEIVNLLVRDSLCVVCNHRTTGKTWTVPLCSEVCRNKFRFGMPQAWISARGLVMKDRLLGG